MRVETNQKVGLIQTYRLTQFLCLYSDFLAFYGSCSIRAYTLDCFYSMPHKISRTHEEFRFRFKVC